MNRVLLNIGCGNKKLAGFTNVDMEPGADIQLDVTKGLPFDNNSVHAIFSEHFFEHITQAQGGQFLRECRRVLVPGGVCRIATPDLDALINEYTSNDWLNPEWAQFGYNYLDNKCEMLNLALREWGHQWVYNEEELVRLGESAGFEFGGRHAIGESPFEFLRGLEYRAGSRLIAEFIKPVRAKLENPLVSILIPSYKPAHFREALESALTQTYTNIEIVVADDCPTDAIATIVREYDDARIRYQRNEPALGSYENHLHAFALARGEYIKFLCDDDLLHPTCIDRMVKCLNEHADVTLVTSHRQYIDANGNHLPDIAPTQRIAQVDSVIDGVYLANAMLSRKVNFIGEPTTVMFRKRDLANIRPNCLCFGGRRNLANGDMTMWMNLLSKGDAIYLIDTLSYFRKHEGQEQQHSEFASRGSAAVEQLVFDAQRMGFLSPYAITRTMSRPLHPGATLTNPKERTLDELHELSLQHPQNSQYHNELGVLQFQQGEKEEALASFLNAVKFDDDNIDALRNLADAAIDIGRIEKALRVLQTILDKVPNDVESLIKLGHLSCMLKRFDDGAAFYHRVTEVEPTNETALSMLCELASQKLAAPDAPEAGERQNGRRGEGASASSIPILPFSKHDVHSPRKERELLATIIIPVFNKLEFTRTCIKRVYENTRIELGVEVIVVDNASTDGTAEWLAQAAPAYPNLRFIRNATNVGFGKACNAGANMGQGKYIIFLNNDTEVQDGWLDAMIDVAAKEENVGVVGCKLLYPDGTIQHAGVAFAETKSDTYNLPVPFHIYKGMHGSAALVNEQQDMDSVTAACMLIPKDIFDAVGGFDERYVMYFEDTDLVLRIREKGYRAVYTPKAVVIHHESKSSTKESVTAHNLASVQIFYPRWKSMLDRRVRDAYDVKTPVVWSGEFLAPNGWATEFINHVIPLERRIPLSSVQLNTAFSKQFVDGLPAYAQETLIRTRNRMLCGEPYILISHTPANDAVVAEEAVYKIIRTSFETDRLPKNWVKNCNKFDEVWAPSEFNRETFARSGVKRDNILVVPGAVDVNSFDPGIVEPMNLEGKKGFNFLSVFEWNERKGADVLLNAYFEEFSNDDDVCLFLRTHLPGRFDHDDAAEIESRIAAIAKQTGKPAATLPCVRVIGKHIPATALPDLYKACDAFVLSSRGESRCRTLLEAMAMELPCIATKWAAGAELLNGENSYPLNVERVATVKKSENPAFIGHQWAEPSVLHLKELMRRVYQHRDEAAEKGRQARRDVVERFSQDVVSSFIIKRLQQIEAKLREPEIICSDTTIPRVVWEGTPFAYHSLSLVNRELCNELLTKGVELSLTPFGSDHFNPGKASRFGALARRRNVVLERVDVHVRHHWPPNLDAPGQGRFVFMQPWEFGSLPKAWVGKIRSSVDEVWACTKYVRDVYVTSGVPAERVAIVPNGFNPRQFHPKVKPTKLKTKKKFKFLFVGGTIWRKGIDILLDTYTKAFKKDDDVCLVIKDMGGDSFYKGQTFKEVIQEIQKSPDSPEIEYIDRILPDDELTGLYTACNVLVHPYRGEGFGMPVLEAMACGTPAIITQGGSTDDFCNETNSILIPATRVQFPSKFIGHDETVDFPWVLEPDKNVLATKMRLAILSHDELKEIGKRASEDAHAQWTWKHAAEKARVRIEALKSKPIIRIAPKEASVSEEALLAGAYQLYSEKRFDDALLILNNAHWRDDATKLDALNLRGACYLSKRDLSSAKESFEAALQLQPRSSEACAGLGEVFFLLEKDREAKTMFEHAVVNDEQNAAAVSGLAKVNAALGLAEDDNSLLVLVGEEG
jgi:GT2 family glycosyltransferase/predicted SAM-dependent methyltransferase/cytochrome c-type biogenesis protein CcmH/NrfG